MLFIFPSCVSILSVQQVTRAIVSSFEGIAGDNHHYIKFKCVVGNKHHYIKLFLLLLSLSPCLLQKVLKTIVSSSQLGFLTLSLCFYYKKTSNTIFFVSLSMFSLTLSSSLFISFTLFFVLLCFYLLIFPPLLFSKFSIFLGF